MKFIDISNNNLIKSYSNLNDSNLGAVIIKATEGATYQDTKLSEYVANISKPIGFYHFLRTSSSPIEQAHNFWNTIKNFDFKIIPILDVENYNNELVCKAEKKAADFIKEFLEISGLERIIIYSNQAFIIEEFSNDFIKNNLWWVANYSNAPLVANAKIVAWQYTESETEYKNFVDKVDCNYLALDSTNDFFYNYEEYNLTSYNILFLQTELNKQGYKDKNGGLILLDGIGGELTLSALPIVKKGATGNITRWIQSKVGVAIDGIFGSETVEGVVGYQARKNLYVDGIVGKETWEELIK